MSLPFRSVCTDVSDLLHIRWPFNSFRRACELGYKVTGFVLSFSCHVTGLGFREWALCVVPSFCAHVESLHVRKSGDYQYLYNLVNSNWIEPNQRDRNRIESNWSIQLCWIKWHRFWDGGGNFIKFIQANSKFLHIRFNTHLKSCMNPFQISNQTNLWEKNFF